MRRVVIRMTGQCLLRMMSLGKYPAHEIIQGVPDGAKIINVRWGWPDVVEILIESDKFEIVPEGEIIPELMIIARS